MTNGRGMKSASRTLVKSPPEVWEQLDHPGRMQGLMCALVGHATDVSVYEREEESKLAWKAVPDDAWIEVEIAEKGWGTNVSVSAENGGEPTKLEGWLDAVIEELATPQKRPFGGMSEPPPAETSLAAVSLETPSDEEAPLEEAPVEERPVEERPVDDTLLEAAPVEEPAEEAPVEEAPAEAPAPAEPPRKKRRFFRFGF
jgi:hypothetical protein